MTDLTEFLEFLAARIADDEAVALAARDAATVYDHRKTALAELIDLGENEGGSDAAVQHAARWTAERALAECEAKRRIIGWVTDPTIICEVADPILRELARLYADHPDFREEWRR